MKMLSFSEYENNSELLGHSVGSYTFPLLCVVLSDFFILLGISSTDCSSLSAELFTSGLSSRMLSVQKVQRIIEAL